MTINSATAFVLYGFGLFGAYMLTIWFDSLPFLAFASQLTLGFGAYIAKRAVVNTTEIKNAKMGE